jgi:hypothetical protein
VSTIKPFVISRTFSAYGIKACSAAVATEPIADCRKYHHCQTIYEVRPKKYLPNIKLYLYYLLLHKPCMSLAGSGGCSAKT